jgi:hypothetical protein
MPVYPVTVEVALRAGQLDGENQAHGLQLALPDLLIGVTALELGYSVGTSNVRHFGEVLGLSVGRSVNRRIAPCFRMHPAERRMGQARHLVMAFTRSNGA